MSRSNTRHRRSQWKATVPALVTCVNPACREKHLPHVAGDIRHSTACTAAAAEVLGFSPRYSLQDGLAELFQDSVKRCKSSGSSGQEVP
jgi:nucleoside-diphosphate-sugar epimerase